MAPLPAEKGREASAGFRSLVKTAWGPPTPGHLRVGVQDAARQIRWWRRQWFIEDEGRRKSYRARKDIYAPQPRPPREGTWRRRAETAVSELSPLLGVRRGRKPRAPKGAAEAGRGHQKQRPTRLRSSRWTERSLPASSAPQEQSCGHGQHLPRP